MAKRKKSRPKRGIDIDKEFTHYKKKRTKMTASMRAHKRRAIKNMNLEKAKSRRIDRRPPEEAEAPRRRSAHQQWLMNQRLALNRSLVMRGDRPIDFY